MLELAKTKPGKHTEQEEGLVLAHWWQPGSHIASKLTDFMVIRVYLEVYINYVHNVAEVQLEQ